MNAEPSSRDQARQAADRVLGDGSLELDLSSRPSREDLGVSSDRGTRHVVQRGDHEPFQATITFTDGRELSTEASVLGVETSGPGAAPSGITLLRNEMTLDELRSALEAAVETVAADRQHVAQYLAKAERAEGGEFDLNEVISTRVRPPDRLELQPIVTAREGRVSLQYHVAWE